MSELCDDNRVEGQSQRQSMSGGRRVWKPHVLPRKYLEQGMCNKFDIKRGYDGPLNMRAEMQEMQKSSSDNFETTKYGSSI